MSVKLSIPYKLIAVLLSVAILLVSLPLSALAVDNGSSTAPEETLTETVSSSTAEIIEIPENRSADSKTFRLTDGSFYVAHYNTGIHEKDESGNWQDIDNRLYHQDELISTKDGKFAFPSKTSSGAELFSLKDGKHSVSFAVADIRSGVEGEISNQETKFDETADPLDVLTTLDAIRSSVSYADILPETDIEYVLYGTTVKESLILKSFVQELSYSFILLLEGLSPVCEEGTIYLLDDETNDLVYRLPAPVMWDSEDAFSDEIEVVIEELENGSFGITYLPDPGWLNDPERVYPVIIDPSVYSSFSSVMDLSVNVVDPWSPAFDGATTLYVSNGWNVYWRMTTLPQLPANAYITNATISMTCFTSSYLDGHIGVYGVTSAWSDILCWQQVLNNTAGVPESTFTDQQRVYTYYVSGEGYRLAQSEITWNVTPIVKNWYAGPNHGLMFQPVGSSFTGTAMFRSNDYNTSSVRPQLTISYADLKGVEDYWSFTSQDAGFAGTAYVHNATGNAVVNIPTLTSTDALLPVSPALVYDASMRGTAYAYPNAQTAVTSALTPLGFKLNLTETLIRKNYTGASGTTESLLIWSDPDGTEHYFFPTPSDNTVFEDEDGLHLTIQLAVSGCSMKNSSDTVKTFTPCAAPTGTTGAWVLTDITDKSGNRVHITLDAYDRPVSVSLLPNGYADADAIEQLRIGYNSCGVPYAVWNPTSGEGVVFRYSQTYNGSIGTNCGSYLRQAVRVHNCMYSSEPLDFYNTNANNDTFLVYVDAVAEYTYDSSGLLTKLTNTKSEYELWLYPDSTGRIYMFREYSTNLYDIGQTLTFDYGTFSTTVRSSGKDDFYCSSDDLLTTFVFDGYGRSINAYTTSLDHEKLYGASSGQFVGEKDWNNGANIYSPKARNVLKTSIQTSEASANYLLNGGFDTGTFQYWNTAGQVSISPAAVRNGYYSAELELSAIVSLSSVSQTVSLEKGDYTLSLDLNTFQTASDVSVCLRAESLTVPTRVFETRIPVNEYYAAGRSSAAMTFDADPVTSGEKEQFSISVRLTRTGSSSAYLSIDNIMLSKAIGACEYDYTKAGHFESCNGSVSSFWTIQDQASTPVTVVNSGSPLFGDVLCVSVPFDEPEVITQTVYQATDYMKLQYVTASAAYDTEPVSFSVFGWAKGTGQSYGIGSDFCIEAVVRYYTLGGNYEEESFVFDFDRGVTEWQFLSGTFATDPLPGMIDSIRILLKYTGHQGIGYFDNISVVRSDSNANLFEYGNANGHLTKQMTGDRIVEYVYDENNVSRIETILDRGSKTVSTVTYDLAGRILTETNSKYTNSVSPYTSLIDLNQTTYTYNSYGLITEILCEDLETSGLQTRTQTEYDTTQGSHLFGTVLSETDPLGNQTLYFRDSGGGWLLAVLYSDGTGTAYRYDGMGNLTEVLPAVATQSNSYSTVYGQTDVEYGYDPDTNRLDTITTFADSGRSTIYTFFYDGFGNPEETKVGNRTLASYDYNYSNGKLNQLTYGNGLQVRYVYDELNRISEIRHRQGNSGSFTTVYSYTYTAAGRLYSITDHESDEVTLYNYDSTGKLIGSCVYDETTYRNKFGSSVDYDEQSRVDSIVYRFDYPSLSGPDCESLHYFYSYNDKGSIQRLWTSGSDITGTIKPVYDNLGRTKTRTLDYNIGGSDAFYNKLTYSYENNGNYATGRIEKVESEIRMGENTSLLSSSTWQYEYDSSGNIEYIKDAADVVQYHYVYDSLGQLTREDNRPLNQSYEFEYDHAGNITSKMIYAFTTGTLGVVLDTVTYSYNDSSWGDLLTSFDGTSITYDTIGNPTQIGSTQLTWKGRQLQSYSPGFYYNTSFTYNADGIRTSKTYTAFFSDTRHEYTLDGSQIVKETVFVNNVEEYCLVYLYDETGSPIGFRYRTPSYAQNVFDGYFYEKNIQGDIIGIWDEFGTKIVSYIYDAWGNVTVSGTGANGIGAKNPYRYRGYYFDTETGLYYLQTRYYNQNWGRFINADVLLNGGLLGDNQFAYCSNNPEMMVDHYGDKSMPWGMLPYPGYIHRMVQLSIAFKEHMRMEVQIEGSLFRVDLVDDKGHIYEVKPVTWINLIDAILTQLKRYYHEGNYKPGKKVIKGTIYVGVYKIRYFNKQFNRAIIFYEFQVNRDKEFVKEPDLERDEEGKVSRVPRETIVEGFNQLGTLTLIGFGISGMLGTKGGRGLMRSLTDCLT